MSAVASTFEGLMPSSAILRPLYFRSQCRFPMAVQTYKKMSTAILLPNFVFANHLGEKIREKGGGD